MEKSNIKKLKEHLREILAKEEYKEKNSLHTITILTVKEPLSLLILNIQIL